MSLARSHLCFSSQVWAPQSVLKDTLLIESVQRRATRSLHLQEQGVILHGNAAKAQPTTNKLLARVVRFGFPF